MSLKIISRKTDLPNLNSNYYAFPIFNTIDTVIPFSESTGSFDETQLKEMNEVDGRAIITHIVNESIPLKKVVTAPYTLQDSDHDRILHVNGSGNITVPPMNYGFECGFVQSSLSSNNISFVASSGATILKPSDKQASMLGQYYSCYLMSNEVYVPGSVLQAQTTNFLLTGDLKPL
jgi:hypothetical protein